VAALDGVRPEPLPAGDPVSAVADRFAAWWRAPDPDTLSTLLHDDVVLEQPVVAAIHGLPAACRFFTRLLAWLPDAHGEVHRHAVVDASVFIDWTLHATVGKAKLRLAVVDRLLVRDGKISVRRAYYDSLSFTLLILRHPRAWLGYLRFLRHTARG
jgi:limonene-1,2-epoxide hydrolase